MSAQFLEIVKARRTYYALSNKSHISNERLEEIVQQSVLHTPSAFNIQSGRAVLLVGAHNQKAWSLVRKLYLESLGDDKTQIEVNSQKFDGYAAGYGSVIFFEDQAILNNMIAKMPYFKNVFPIWSENSSGMIQYIVWTALEAEGLGANLQHHGSYVDTIGPALTKEFGLPPFWKCTALMPFGAPTGPPGMATRPKSFEPIENRVKAFF